MKIEIFGKDYNVSDSLKAITEKKCAKLDKYFNDDDDAVAKFVVTLEGGTYTTDMTVVYRSQSYRAEASSPSPFDNIDEVIPRLLGQIRKQKDIWGKTKRGAENVYEEEEV
ncbi:MAG: ribosome hibernation-promoting factor, HPF/YfiA family [Acutalibacteraceae bacterium]